jgi:hypothetical protein
MTDKVRQNKERFDRKVEDVRNHPDLSAEAKRRYLSEAYAQAKAEHDRHCVEHKESRRSIADLERKVFEVNMPLSVSPHEKETFRISYRDAYERAERVGSSVELPQRAEALKSLFERASSSGDTQQADAVYHLAVERALFGVADAYRETRSKAKERWEKNAAARQEAESLESRLFGWVGPRKPHERGGSSPGLLGQGIGDMHGDRSPGGGFSETG